MCPGHLDVGASGEAAQAAGGRVPVHPRTAVVQQDRPADPGGYRPVDGPAGRGRQRDQDDLGALAAYAQNPVTTFLADFGDVRAGDFEDPQAEQPGHGHQREVARVRRVPGGGEQASNCRCVNPRVGDSAGTAGQRKCPAGECGKTPSRTQVR